MELTSFKLDFLLHNRERLKERIFLIDAMTKVASRPSLWVMDGLPTEIQPEYTINLLQLKEGRKYIQPSKDEIRGYPESVQTWMLDYPESELIDQYDNVIDLINHYQNYLALDQEQKELSDQRCKELHYPEAKTQLAIEFFIKKTKHSIIADNFCIEPSSVTMSKWRMKKDLEK